jgi:hypothetical protein
MGRRTGEKRIVMLDDTGNHLIKLIGTYEVVVWRMLLLYFGIRHFLGI